MKRINNLYERICFKENIEAAAMIAQKGKKKQYGVQMFNRDPEGNLEKIRNRLIDGSYRTSVYTTFKVFEPKERVVYRLPFNDRIVHHAAMNVLEPEFVKVFTSDTYSCIKGRGIYAATVALRKALKDEQLTQYCLKMDIKKFYPNVDHEILKNLLRRKFKDQRLLKFLDEIIESAPGLPIGNYMSQYFANFYLAYFDHWLKEEKRVKYYFRYCDDLVILGDSKDDLHSLRIEISQYVMNNLKLSVKSNYQVFPVSARGIDVFGYVHYHTHVRVRKSIKQNFARMMANNPNQKSFASYYGWLKHCNGNHLLKKLAS